MATLLHDKNITVDSIQSELRVHQSRLEEKFKRIECDCSYFEVIVDDGDENCVTNDDYVEIAKNSDGNTPLMSATCFGNVVVFEFLVSISAGIEAKNNVPQTCTPTKIFFETCIHGCCFCSVRRTALVEAGTNNHIHIVELLLKARANINVKNMFRHNCFSSQFWCQPSLI